MSVVPKIRERSHEETLHQKRCARREAWDLSKIFTSSRMRTKLRFILQLKQSIDSGASMDMMSKKRIKLRRDGHSKKVENPYSSVDRKRRSANPRGGTSVRWWSQSVRNRAITRWNACGPSLAKTTDTPMSGSAVKSYDSPKTGKPSSAKQVISHLLSFQGYPPIRQAVRFSASLSQDSLRKEAERATSEQITRGPCRRRNSGAVPRAEIFGGLIAADHKVLSEGCESRDNHRYAVVVQGLATQWIQFNQCKTKTSPETEKSVRKYFEPSQKTKRYLYWTRNKYW